MDYQENDFMQDNFFQEEIIEPEQEKKPSRGFSLASLILGIAGIATGCCVYPGIVCGTLAIMFALLSKGGQLTLPKESKIGLILGIISTVFGILIVVISLVTVFVTFGGIENYMAYYFELMGIDPSTFY